MTRLSVFSSLIIALISLTSSKASAELQDLRGIYKNNSAINSLSQKRVLEAEERLMESLVDLPLDARIHFNLGRTFLAKKEFAKAKQESLTAAGLAQIPEVKFFALFNAAIAATELKNVDEALVYYQSALEIVPDSVEVKTNIELLIQSQSGKGEGEGQDQNPQDNPNQDQQGNGEKDKKDQQQQPKDEKDQQNKPKPFKGKDLNEADVNRILEELKRQEEQIRSKSQREGAKDAPRDKDW